MKTYEWGVLRLQEAMVNGHLTARSLVHDCLERIQRLDRAGPRLRSVIEVNPDALDAAATSDDDRRKGMCRGPLHGIPVLVKANIDTADRTATTAGSLALSGHLAQRDAGVVDRLRQSGAILLGKANLSEWANFRGRRSTSGWSSLGGQTRNPHALDRSPCGSSSGSAVAVAAGLCPVAVGTETDGSIVCPAHANGIVGLKPTVGLVSRSGIIPIARSQDTAGPLGRTVEDVAVLLSAMTGDDPRDPATRAAQGRGARDYSRFLDPHGADGMRVGVARPLTGTTAASEAVLDRAIQVLRRLGARLVDPVDLSVPAALREEEFQVLLYEFKDGINRYLRTIHPCVGVRSLARIIAFNNAHQAAVMPHFGQEALILAQAKGPLSEAAYVASLTACRRMARDEGIDAVLRRHRLDAIVAPSGGPAWLIDPVHGDYNISGASTLPAVAGYPHITVPAGFHSGLPMGVSFFAGAFSEPTLLRLAYAYEQATHHHRWPRFLPRAPINV